MGRVRRLSPELANQIAAGEVVERPASVVKELVENAVDAGARRISITVELGGKRRIRVEDDGEGMHADDARLAIERHATSKIAEAADLGRIATLGFRGEALPSIASVSRFTLRSRARGTATGTEIAVEAGAALEPREVGMAEGTVVEVDDLFFNLPARRKFLKSDAAEAAQVSRVTTQLALCYPEVGFLLTSGGRTVLHCAPVASLADRLFQLLGDRPDLVEVRREGGDVQVHGFVAALADQGPTRGGQNLFVNRRIVKDRTVAHAVLHAYGQASIKERSPEVYLFLEMPHDALDVNVHPTKAEVRFRDQPYIHQLVSRAVADALGRGDAPEITLHAVSSGLPIETTLPLPHAYSAPVPSRWAPPRGSAAEASTDRVREEPARPESPDATGTEHDAPAGPAALAPMMPLGQFRDTFIIAVDQDGIAIIDQHVAHERVLFERISARLAQAPLESQRLLEPMLVDLAPGALQAVMAHSADLDRLGFEVGEFGGGTLRVTAYPAVLPRAACAATVRALADDLEGLDRGSPADSALNRLAATMACHAAVKAHDALTPEKMAYILAELQRTAYSTVCPHGRPVMLRLTRHELEKRFERV